jgi:hypothetical protein
MATASDSGVSWATRAAASGSERRSRCSQTISAQNRSEAPRVTGSPKTALASSSSDSKAVSRDFTIQQYGTGRRLYWPAAEVAAVVGDGVLPASR